MIMAAFSAQKADVLDALLRRSLSEAAWPRHMYGETEPRFTARVVRPWLERFVSGLNEPALAVRSDGEVPPPGLMLGRMAFRPDAAIVHFGTRLVSFEVKFLRAGQDPTGAFAKALGQAVIYKDAGYAHSHLLLFDSVNSRLPRWGGAQREPLLGAGVGVNWYGLSADGYTALSRG